jgi:preprotein translocase subunit SecG
VGVIGYILMTVYVVACLVLILFVLLQPGKADASAVFGGGVNSAAFGPRGTQTVLAKVTIGAAIIFFVLAFLFSIPNLMTKRSLGEGAGPAEAQPPAPIMPSIPPADSSAATPPAPAATEPDKSGDGKAAEAKPADKTGKPASSNSAKPDAQKK